MARDLVPATDGLEITVHHSDQGNIVQLRGRLSIDSSPALRERLVELLQTTSPEAVTVDLADVSYIDSSGVATLIEGLKMARMRQTDLCIQGLQGRVLHFFEVTGISTLFEKNSCGIVSPPKVS